MARSTARRAIKRRVQGVVSLSADLFEAGIRTLVNPISLLLLVLLVIELIAIVLEDYKHPLEVFSGFLLSHKGHNAVEAIGFKCLVLLTNFLLKYNRIIAKVNCYLLAYSLRPSKRNLPLFLGSLLFVFALPQISLWIHVGAGSVYWALTQLSGRYNKAVVIIAVAVYLVVILINGDFLARVPVRAGGSIHAGTARAP